MAPGAKKNGKKQIRKRKVEKLENTSSLGPLGSCPTYNDSCPTAFTCPGGV